MATPWGFSQSSPLTAGGAYFSTNLTSFLNTTGPSTEMSQGPAGPQTAASYQGLQDYLCDQLLPDLQYKILETSQDGSVSL